MMSLLLSIRQMGMYIFVSVIILAVVYHVFSALAYGIARSIMQAARDHKEASVQHKKEKQNEDDTGTKSATSH